MRKAGVTLALAAALYSPAPAWASDVVRDWNAIAIGVPAGSPFNQARIVAATQLAVFEAVNAIQGGYESYTGIVTAPPTASVDAAVIVAANLVLKSYVPGSAASLDAARMAGLSAIPDGAAKSSGIATGEAAAAAILGVRFNDGAIPAESYLPGPSDPWQLTAACPATGGLFYNWRNIRPFGIGNADDFRADPPPALTSVAYAKAFNEVKEVGRNTSTTRPQHRTDVARFYAATSPAYIFNMAARQISEAQGRSQLETARALALINMAISDGAVASFATKYHYKTARPETAIHHADADDNDRTEADASWAPLIPAPCFPSYASNHASLSSAGAEVLRRLYGEGEHSITITNPAFPTLIYQYSTFNQILNDISDARVFGGIHFRYDQDAGERLGRAVGTAVYKDNLRAANGGLH